jgi:hypothetical protein
VTPDDPIAKLLVQHLPRDLVMGIEDALTTGARRAYSSAEGMNPGHLASVIGHMRHFHMNETFHDALAAAGASPTELRGNTIVVGRAGIFAVGRFNISRGMWNHGSRSQARRKLAQENRYIEGLLQPELFGALDTPVTTGAVFFVAEFSGLVHHSPEAPLFINVAVPDRSMQQWLFWEPVSLFLMRYNVAETQADLAIPVLKSNIRTAKQKKEGEGG